MPVEPPRYQLVSRLATGGMAEVFLAIMPGDCGTAKPVVIKRLWPELARDPECVQLFLSEVRLSLRLNHPNVIHAYESGSDGDRYFLAMEYLDGQSLKHILDRFAATPSQAAISLPLGLKIVSDLLTALDYVHSLADLDGSPLRVVHRDVSPQNVFVTCDGTVKLIDFGIAETASNVERRRTPRNAKGRVAYMAPEQAAGGAVDHRADLFSVGVMLWELAVGRRLWQGQSSAEIRGRLLSGEPVPRLPRSQGFPPGLAAICSRALAIDPGDRYASAVEFQSDLGVLLTGSMPVQVRLLGDMVSRVFASSRALSRSMIQQSLPKPRAKSDVATVTARRPSGQDLPLIALPESAADERGEFPRSSRSSGFAIAAAPEEVTQVSLQPDLRLRPRFLIPGWLLVATGICVAVGLASFTGRDLFNRTRSVPLVTSPPPPRTPSPPQPEIVVLPTVPGPAAILMADSKVAEQAQPARMGDPERPIPKPHWARKPSPSRPDPNDFPDKNKVTSSRRTEDFFEISRATLKQPRLAHTIDHEDPYAR